MSHRIRLSVILVLILISSGLARSQQPAPVKKSSAEVEAMRAKALDLLESLAGDVDTLRSAENRARIGSNIADLLWDHNEKRARVLFAKAEEDLKALGNEDVNEPERYNTLRVFAFLRSNIIFRIAKHDPELALQFLQSTRPTVDAESPDEVRSDVAIENQLARSISKKNPQLALKVAKESLSSGFSHELLDTLAQLRETDKDAAASLTSAIIEKLRSVNLIEQYAAFEVALSLASLSKTQATNEQDTREVVGIILKNAGEYGCTRAESEQGEEDYYCQRMASIFPLMEKYFGPRAAGMRQWVHPNSNSDYEASLNNVYYRIQEAYEKGTIDDLLALAEQNPESRNDAYRYLAAKARSLGDFQKAREAVSKISDPEQKQMMLSQLEEAERMRSTSAERMAEVQRTVGELPNNEKRLEFLARTVMALDAVSDRKTVLSLLNQMSQIQETVKPGRDQIGGNLALATLFAELKSERGFAIMESMIPKLNELVTAAATLDRIDNSYLRDGEWAMKAEGTLGGMLKMLSDRSGHFAWLDFDRAVNLAKQFERPELRIMAQSKLAQAILEGTGKEATDFQGGLNRIH